MKIKPVQKPQHADFLALVNAEIRPDRAKTNAWDDFPLILGLENMENQLVALDEKGEVAGGIACLIREFSTSCGNVQVAGIGSVVTRLDHRGKGLSKSLQNAMLDLLRGKNVPLAVLWTDQPEIYSGRGFQNAGWEIHGDLKEMADPPLGIDMKIRPYTCGDVAAIEALYNEHPLRTLRLPGDSATLYEMPGTRGLVITGADDRILASVFCGKGADFPDYVTEWSGSEGPVLSLLAEVRNRGWAHRVLIPAGREALANSLVDLGGSWFCLESGMWCILDESQLGHHVQQVGGITPTPGSPAPSWLGSIDESGQPLVGPLTLGVWGFDSV